VPNSTNSTVVFSQELLEEILADCIAFASYQEAEDYCVECKSICQREENPCLVDIDYEVCGPGVFEFVPEHTAFSLDSTNGINGTWHILQAVETDPLHTGNEFTITQVRGSGRFVADLCDHVSSFFSEPNICFRLTIRKKASITPPSQENTGGPFQNPGGSVTPGLRTPSN
jgi:hypothetical protein